MERSPGSVRILECCWIGDDVAVARYHSDRDDSTIGWTPVLSYLSAYGFTGGARVFHRDLFRHRETLSLEVSGGGLNAQLYELRFYGDDVGGRRLWIDARVLYDVTPRLVFQGITSRDLIVVKSVVMLLVFAIVLVTFLVDITYALVDPRLRRAAR